MPTLDDLLRAEFGESYENLVDSLPVNTSVAPYQTRPLTDITMIVLHHTAVSRATTWEAVARYHTASNGWNKIGYHIAVRQDDNAVMVSLLNDPATHSYHAGPVGNTHGLAVVLAGDFTSATPTVQEVDTLRRVVSVVRAWATWAEWLPVVGHGEVEGNDTNCPGAGMAGALAWLKSSPTLDPALKLVIWEAAKGAQTIEPHPGSAIELLMQEQGYQPIGGEADVLLGVEWQGVTQLGYAPGYNADGVAFFATNKTSNGQWQVWMVEET